MSQKYTVMGTWDIEPDYLEGEYLGIKWEIRRNLNLGFLLGYIIVPLDTIWDSEIYSKVNNEESYYSIPDGGVTYSEKINYTHIKIGFDCGHYYHIKPFELTMDNVLDHLREERYCTIEQVKDYIYKMIELDIKYRNE